ncbi:hypothetical protein SD78_4047 [Bacillus badius]|nr:hypothetical protein SD78_4047 [Bacillus badius]
MVFLYKNAQRINGKIHAFFTKDSTHPLSWPSKMPESPI